LRQINDHGDKHNIIVVEAEDPGMRTDAFSRRSDATCEHAGAPGVFHVDVRPTRDFVCFHVQDVGGHAGIERVTGKRTRGAWCTVQWLISKTRAHLENGRLVPDSTSEESAAQTGLAAGAPWRRPFPGKSAPQDVRGHKVRPSDSPQSASQQQGPSDCVAGGTSIMIRKLPSGKYRLYSRKKNTKTGKRRNLGTFSTRAAAEKHERAVQYFKRH
jgi:hypothetical protein